MIDCWITPQSGKTKRYRAVASVDGEIVWRGQPKPMEQAQHEALWQRSRLERAAADGRDPKLVARA